MTDKSRNTPLYPKSHLLAASGIAALLSLTLLVFPSSQVEAKKTLLPLEIENSSDVLADKDDLQPSLVTSERLAVEKPLETLPPETQAAKPAQPRADYS